jgi:hypothetical protein
MSSLYGKGAKGRATQLSSRIVRARGRCERCGATSNLEAAHIIRRDRVGDPDGIALRTNPENQWCLCSSCHRWTENYPDDFMLLVRETIGEARYFEFKRVGNAPHRLWRAADWEAECVRLRAVLDGATA